MYAISEKALYIFCFFPYVKFLPFAWGTDTQPWALCFSIGAILMILFDKKKIIIPKNFFQMTAIVTGSTILLLLLQDWLPTSDFYQETKLNYVILRGLLSAASMIAITYIAYFMFSAKGLQETYIKVIINVYLIVGLVQKFVRKDFLNFILCRSTTSANRGVVALTTEPSFYAHICFFLLLFVYDFKKDKWFYAINLIFQIIILATSTAGLTYLFVLAMCMLIREMRVVKKSKMAKFLFAGIAGSFSAIIVLNQIAKKMKGQRIGMFLNFILAGEGFKAFWTKMLSDASFSIRFHHITDTITAFIQDYGMPHGLNNRAGTGYGMLIYQYGIMGLIIIIYVFWIVKENYFPQEPGGAFALALTIVMFSSVQITTPTLWFYLGYCLSKCRKGREERNSQNITMITQKTMYN